MREPEAAPAFLAQEIFTHYGGILPLTHTKATQNGVRPLAGASGIYARMKFDGYAQ